MMKLRGIAGTLLALIPAAAAQNQLVHPPQFQDKLGQTYTYYQFRSYVNQTDRQCRFMQVHDLNQPGAMTIQKLAFRYATYSDYDLYYKYQPWTADVELVLSTSPLTGGTMNSTFAANAGPDATTVIARKTLSFPPKMLPSPTQPAPFLFQLPFDAGKSFPLAAGKSLCWDQRVHDNNLYDLLSTHVYLDTAYLTTGYTNGYFGQGSLIPGGHRYYGHYGYLYDSFSTTALTHTLYGTAYYGPAFGKSFMVLATRRTPAGIPIGPTATLYLDPGSILGIYGPYDLNYYGYTPNASSTYPFLKVPHAPGMEGLHLFGQWFSFDPAFANLYSTHGILLQLPMWTSTTGLDLGCSRLYAYGSTAFTAATGTFSKNYSVVTEFTY